MGFVNAKSGKQRNRLRIPSGAGEESDRCVDLRDTRHAPRVVGDHLTLAFLGNNEDFRRIRRSRYCPVVAEPFRSLR